VSLAFECASPAELDEIYARVVAAGFEGEKALGRVLGPALRAARWRTVRVNLYAALG
jgi:hypothetical protein